MSPATLAAPSPTPGATTTAAFPFSRELVPLIPAVQNYAWGIVPRDADSIVARMHAYSSGAPVHPTRPYAELWIGTHASGPAVLRHSRTSLADFLVAGGQQPKLPYLLKILSVAKPLSIQAHPDKALAERLHHDNPHAYKDDNHKPEMAVALTDFEGMCNFRPVAEILENLQQHSELASLVGGKSALESLSNCSSAEGRRAAIRAVFSSLMSASEETVASALDTTVKAVKVSSERSGADDLFLRLVSYYEGDVGCFAAYLLNHVRISPGEAFFMAANEPHAYLKGQCVEIMACSDNVVRAGLTPKFKDVSTLVDMLTYKDDPPKIMTGEEIDQCSVVYKPPVEEFQLTKTVVAPGSTYEIKAAKGSGMIMVTGGQGWIGVTKEEGEKPDSLLPLQSGSVYYVADSTALWVKADNTVTGSDPSADLLFFRANISQD